MTTIHIYDDNYGLRQSLEQLLALSEEFAVTGSFDNCRQAETEVKKNPPDIILMDIDMPGMIASELHIAFETVRSYIKKIYEKLQVHSATEAVSKAINEKLV